MTEPTQRQVDADIERSMDLFERADVGGVSIIEGSRPQRVVFALDGSSQDETLLLLAEQLSQRFKCSIGYLQVSPTDDVRTPDGTTQDATVLSALQALSAEQLAVDDGPNYDQILAAVAKFNADLLLAPCPFGRDFESLGEDSTGTVIDVLTARSTVPFIAIRRPDATGRDPTNHLRMLLTGGNPAADVAARWAVGMVQPTGRLELLLLVEESFYENFRAALHAIRPDVEVRYEDLENALARTYGRLHAALQRTAHEVGFTYKLLIRHEKDEQPITPEDPRTHPALMVLALERGSHDSQSEVNDFVRRSPHPVFVAVVE